MSLIPTETRWKLLMPDGQDPKKPNGKADFILAFVVILCLTVSAGITIGVVIGGLWPWPF